MKETLMSFEDHVKRQALQLRNIFAGRNESRLNFTIEVDGRADGDIRITYGLGGYSAEVSGDTVEAVLEEYFRRKGWTQRHAPLCLPNTES